MSKQTFTCKPKLRFPEFKNAPEWTVKPMNKLLTIGSGRDYKHLSKGNIPVYGTGGYMLSVDDYLYDGESACIGRKGTINKPIFLNGKFWTVDTLFYTHSFQECLPKFIYFSFLNINWLKYNEAGGVPSLSKTTIGKIDIPTPKKEEQQKISDCLSSIDHLITAQSKKVESLKDHKKALMQHLFPEEGSNIPKLRFPEFKDAPAWDEKELIDISNFITDKIPLNRITLNNYISTENLLADFFGVKVATKLPDIKTVTSFQKGDVLVSNIRPYLNKVWFATFEGGASNDVIIMRAKEKTDSKYLSFLLMNENFINYVMRGAKGVKMPRGDISLIKKYPLSVPTAPEEQQKIASCLSSIDNLIENQSKKVESLKEHKKALMQQLFPNKENK